jgi:hypothetical protein
VLPVIVRALNAGQQDLVGGSKNVQLWDVRVGVLGRELVQAIPGRVRIPPRRTVESSSLTIQRRGSGRGNLLQGSSITPC